MQVKREEIYGKTLLITGYETRPSKFDEKKKYSIITAYEKNREYQFIGNDYMTRQLEKVKLPRVAKLVKTNKGPRLIFISG